jgi:hypothetical protein
MAKLSAAELAKREDVIMKMKKNKRSLVKRYGPDAEKVMYGRATNIAKKVAETQMENLNLKELVRAALMQEKKFPDLTGDGKVTQADILKGRGVDIKEGPEDRDWATYVKSLVNDIRINGIGDYTTFSEDDFIADYEEYIGGKMDLDEDLDLGHEDDEPHMLEKDLYHIGKYAMELYQTMDDLEKRNTEIDFPHWWQSKIIRAKEMMSSAKHYLDFELNEPKIDAAVRAIDQLDVLDNIGVEDEIEEIGMFHDPKGYEKPKPDPKDKIYTKEFKGQGVYDIFKNGEKIKTITGGEGEANAYINKLKRELEDGTYDISGMMGEAEAANTLADILEKKGTLDHLKGIERLRLKLIDGPFLKKNPDWKDKAVKFIRYDAREGLVLIDWNGTTGFAYPRELVIDVKTTNMMEDVRTQLKEAVKALIKKTLEA